MHNKTITFVFTFLHTCEMVCMCICLLVAFVSLAKTTESIEMPFGGWNRALDEVNIPPLERAILGVIRPIEKHWESLEYLQELIRR